MLAIPGCHLKRQLRKSRSFQNCGTFNTNQNKKYHNFERNKIRAVCLKKCITEKRT